MLTATQLTEEIKKDNEAATKKYGGKTVEITGEFDKIDYDTSLGIGNPDKNVFKITLRGIPRGIGGWQPVFCGISTSKISSDPLKQPFSLAQLFTLRGKFDDRFVFGIDNCELVKVGPNTAIPTTLKALNSITTDADLKKFADKDLLVRVTLKEKLSPQSWVVEASPGSTKRIVIEVPFANSLYSDQLNAKKPGESVLILATPTTPNEKFLMLANTRIIEKVPEGLKMPE